MAVDANVLIFERIREEMATGKTIKASVDSGFSRAYSAIIDSNITTFFTGIILFQFGTGPIKGFAITLIIGIAAKGTRKQSPYWKSGFYHIAHQAQIPIVFAFLDYGRKVGGIGPIMNPTGDIEEDMKTVRQFYSGITAKHPHEVGRIAIKPLLENNIPS